MYAVSEEGRKKKSVTERCMQWVKKAEKRKEAERQMDGGRLSPFLSC